LTFAQAFAHSGRILCISVKLHFKNPVEAPSDTMMLSYMNAPHVLIWSAVSASCALPGLLKPHPLLMENTAGDHVPFLSSEFATLDGSLNADVPANELQRLFSVRRVIVSQANPHVTPLLPGGWAFPDSAVPSADVNSWQHPVRHVLARWWGRCSIQCHPPSTTASPPPFPPSPNHFFHPLPV
jgi:predicted acylesterase/phospholipase RssA